MIHLGVHPDKKVVRLEQQSFSHGYCLKDVSGRPPIFFDYKLFLGQVPLMNCCDFDAENSLSECKTLSTVLDCVKIVSVLSESETIQESGLKILQSKDPGRFLCGYVYYCSLYLNDGKSLFVHVPDFDEKITLEVLTNVVEKIIQEIVKQIE